VGCGLCLTGCPYGAIFNSSEFFDKLVHHKKITRIQGKVVQLRQIEDGVKVNYENRLNQIETKEFSHVYVCAGAVGTPIILLRSKLIGTKVSVKDSQVFYFIGFYKPKSQKSELKFSLSRKTITKPNEFSASLYDCNAEVRIRLSEEISRKLLGLRIKLPKFLDRCIFLGIGFLDSDLSGHFEVQVLESGQVKLLPFKNPVTVKSVKKSMRDISKHLRAKSFWVIPWLTNMPPIGAGYHSGASLPIDSQFIDELGRLRTARNVTIADPSLLPKIFAGSHTFNSMAFVHSLIVNKKS
jgi:ferredoxin